MHIEFSDEQVMLRDSADKYLRDNYSFDKRQSVVKKSEGYSREQWQTFADLGWLALPFAEEQGGLGGGPLESMLLCESFGKHLVLEPYLETVVLTGGLISAGATPDLCEHYLPGIIEGRLQGALAHTEVKGQGLVGPVTTTATASGTGFELSGHKKVVFNGPAADLFVVSARTSGSAGDRDGITLFLVDADSPGLVRRNYTTYDGRHASELELTAVAVPAERIIGQVDDAMAQLEAVLDQALLALSAEAVGAMDALIQATVGYTRQRKQFGRPIAEFQVLRHRMAEMFIQCELTRSLLMAAAWKLDNKSPDATKTVAALKALVGKAGRYIGQNAIQLHGGIGVTDELSVGHYFKRLTAIENLFGARDYHLERYSSL